MSNFNYQDLLKALICVGISLGIDTVNADPFNEGPNLIIPRKPQCPKQDWEDKEPQGQVRKKNSLALTSTDQRENYVRIHNKIASKYGLTQHLICPHSSYEDSSLVEEAKKFNYVAIKLKEQEEEYNEQLNTLGQAAIDQGKTLVKSVIDNNGQEESIKGFFSRFIDRSADFMKSFFNK